MINQKKVKFPAILIPTYKSLHILIYPKCPRIRLENVPKNAFFCTTPKNKKHCKRLIYRAFLVFALALGGERGIRTPGTSQYGGFQDRCNRPLCHLSKNQYVCLKSGAKIGNYFLSANYYSFFFDK